jgi:hypothetical protein
MVVSERAQARRTEYSESSRRYLELKPTGGEHSQEMAARKNDDGSGCSVQAFHDAPRPRRDIGGRFAAGTPVAKDIPLRTLGTNFGGAESFVSAIVPFEQIGIDLRAAEQPGKFTGSSRALQWTGPDFTVSYGTKPLADKTGIVLPDRSQGQIGEPGMLAAEAPGSFPMPD